MVELYGGELRSPMDFVPSPATWRVGTISSDRRLVIVLAQDLGGRSSPRLTGSEDRKPRRTRFQPCSIVRSTIIRLPRTARCPKPNPRNLVYRLDWSQEYSLAQNHFDGRLVRRRTMRANRAESAQGLNGRLR